LTTVIAALNTLVPLWLAADAISTSLIGVVGTCFFTGNLVGTLGAGSLIARSGYKWSFLVATFLCVASTLLLIPSGSVAFWIAVRFVGGIACALVWVVVESALLRLGDNHTRASLLAAYMVVYYAATVLGQLVPACLPSDRTGCLLALSGIGLLSLIPILMTHPAPPEPPRSLAVIGAMLVRKRPRLSVLGCVISGILLGSIYGVMPLFLEHRGMSTIEVGQWMALLVGAGIAGQWPLGRLAEVKGRPFVLKLQSWLLIASCLALLLPWGMALSLIVLGAAAFSLYPVTLALGCDHVPHDYLVPMNQTLLFSYTIGCITGPTVSAMAMDHGSDGGMPLFLAVMAAFYLGILILHGRRRTASWATSHQ
jgi:UMF2 family putative MFS family transporter